MDKVQSVNGLLEQRETHGNSIGVSICATATAYEEVNKTTTTETEAKGATVISLTDASGFNVHDIVNFGETLGFEYQVTAVSVDEGTITIKLKDDPVGSGLQTQVSSGTQVRRRWRFYDLFAALQAHQSMQLKIREALKMKYTLLCLIFLEK